MIFLVCLISPPLFLTLMSFVRRQCISFTQIITRCTVRLTFKNLGNYDAAICAQKCFTNSYFRNVLWRCAYRTEFISAGHYCKCIPTLFTWRHVTNGPLASLGTTTLIFPVIQQPSFAAAAFTAFLIATRSTFDNSADVAGKRRLRK